MRLHLSTYTILVISIILIGFGVPAFRHYKVKLSEKKRIEDLDNRLKANKNSLIEDSNTKIVVFYSPYNNTSLIAMKFLDGLSEFDVPVVRRVEGESTFYSDLRDLKDEFKVSVGSSTHFEFYPIIFYKGHAYSGFNNRVERMILTDLGVKEENLPSLEKPCYMKSSESSNPEEVPCSVLPTPTESTEDGALSQ